MGDDIPSIFPIVAGVLLFVGTIFYVNGLVDAKNEYLEIRNAAMGLSYVVTEKGSITKADFDDTCENKLMPLGTSNGVKFLVTIKRSCRQIGFYDPNIPGKEKQSPYFAANSNADGETWLYCSNQEIQQNALVEQDPTAVLLNYPVAVPCDVNGNPSQGVNSYMKGLGIINVIVWK